MHGAVLVAGTTSDAGKSVVVAGLCRRLVREGVKVAPFKAQNMSLNSMVTNDGAEIGRAQAMQAAAARIEPEAVMNPVLLKPGGLMSSQVVLLGKPIAEVGALNYRDLKPRLFEAVLASLADLRSRYDVVVCEGAGSPTEINLRDRDITNMGLARAANLPVLVVGDIDRGGIFASFFGTLALLSREDQDLVCGFVINKFRGDARLLDPALTRMRELTGRPVMGVLPFLGGLWLDVEDSLALDADRGTPEPPLGEDILRVAVVRLPRISNFTDIDALSVEPGVVVRFVSTPGEIADADLVVLPGTRATVADLAWMRERGLDTALARRAAEGRPVLGICGGYQMLGHEIHDDVESREGTVAGLGLLPVRIRFAADKTLARPHGWAAGEPVTAYEIHHGVVDVEAGEPMFTAADGSALDGCRVGAVAGTLWHGALENDGFRRAFLARTAELTGRRFVVSPDTSFEGARQSRLDALGDLVADHLDNVAVDRLIAQGATLGMPFVPPGA